MFVSSTTIPTGHASRYLQQLCKHWSHALAVRFDAAQGSITFPADMRERIFPDAAQVELKAQPGGLRIDLEASDPDQVVLLKRVIIQHLERFAFREAPLHPQWLDA